MTSSRGATHWSGDIMTHDDASVETGVGGQAKYDMMTVFCGNALQKHHKTQIIYKQGGIILHR